MKMFFIVLDHNPVENKPSRIRLFLKLAENEGDLVQNAKPQGKTWTAALFRPASDVKKGLGFKAQGWLDGDVVVTKTEKGTFSNVENVTDIVLTRKGEDDVPLRFEVKEAEASDDADPIPF